MPSRIAIVTGSSSGIGLLTCIELARHDYTVVATMRDLARRERLDKAAADAGVAAKIDVRQLDVTQHESLPDKVAAILRDHGRIDVLVNNAGFVVAGFAEDMKLDEVRRQFETNFFGQIAMTQAVLPAMRKQGSGHIIMVSSESGRMGQPGGSLYCASKFALEGWSETLRIETHSLGIRVVLVEPGAFKTDIWDRNTQLSEVILTGQSPNQDRGRRLKEAVVKLPKADARQVAVVIARLADDPNPKLRYVVGRTARLTLLTRALLPWKAFERLVARKTGIDP